MPHKRNPDPRRAGHRHGAAPSRRRARRPREHGALARARHQPQLGGALRVRAGPRRRRLRHAHAWPTSSTASRSTPIGCAPTWSSLGGMVYSEALLLAMVAKGADRQDAYRLVQGAAKRAWAGEASFADALRGDPAVGEWLTADEIERAMDLRASPRGHRGHLPGARPRPGRLGSRARRCVAGSTRPPRRRSFVSERPALWLPGALAWIASVGWIPFVVAVAPPAVRRGADLPRRADRDVRRVALERGADRRAGVRRSSLVRVRRGGGRERGAARPRSTGVARAAGTAASRCW